MRRWPKAVRECRHALCDAASSSGTIGVVLFVFVVASVMMSPQHNLLGPRWRVAIGHNRSSGGDDDNVQSLSLHHADNNDSHTHSEGLEVKGKAIDVRERNISAGNNTLQEMQAFCAQRPKRMPWGAAQFIGMNAYGQKLLCIRGRQVFATFPAGQRKAAIGAGPDDRNPTNNIELTAASDGSDVQHEEEEEPTASPFKMPVVRGTMRWKQNRVNVKVRNVEDPAIFSAYDGNVTISDALGVIASVYFQAFHIHTNVLIPLVAALSTQCKGARIDRLCPPIDMTLYRELPAGAKLVGGENFSAFMASAMADRGVHVLRRIDRYEDEGLTRCFCDGVLHNMYDVNTMGPNQRVVEGDALRRKSTAFVKQRLNEKFGFLPYGTYPIPTSEYLPFGLWANDTHGGMDPHAPRLLLFLRQRTRTLAQADEIIALAVQVGYNVHVMFPENETVALQARATRYADVVMAVHGQALTWILLMDGVKASHCRSVVELQFFGRPLKGTHNVYEVMSADSMLLYNPVPAAGAIFTAPHCNEGNRYCAAWGASILHTANPVVHPAFHFQSVFPKRDRLQHVLHRVYANVKGCIAANVPRPLPRSYLVASSTVKEQRKKKPKKK